jgi:hypothetical protein
MHIYQRKWTTKGLLLCLVLILALSFTAVVQAGGNDQPVQSGPPGPSRPADWKPPAQKPPMGKYSGPMAPAMPEEENCIGVFTWYDGNLNGIFDGNEDPMDGAKVLLMTPLPAPSMDPPIGPDGKEMVGPEMPMGPMAGPPMGPPQHGPMPPRPMPEKGFAKFQVKDGRVTRDGGTAVFCDLAPGSYILQADAVEGITYGDNRQFTMLEKGGSVIVTFGFKYINGAPESTKGNGV